MASSINYVLLACLLLLVFGDCAYYVNDTKYPNPVVDPAPFLVD